MMSILQSVVNFVSDALSKVKEFLSDDMVFLIAGAAYIVIKVSALALALTNPVVFLALKIYLLAALMSFVLERRLQLVKA